MLCLINICLQVKRILLALLNNVFECYDSQSCKPKFYAGHFYNDIDYIKAQVPNNTREGYINYLKENNEELPKYYFQKRGGK